MSSAKQGTKSRNSLWISPVLRIWPLPPRLRKSFGTMIGLTRCCRIRWLHSRGIGCLVGKRSGCRPHVRHVASASTSREVSHNSSEANFDSSATLRMVQNRVRDTQWQSPSLRGGTMSRTRFRIGVRRPHIDKEEMALLEKHRETLDANELSSIYDVAESIEWWHTVTQPVLDRMLHFLRSPDLNVDSLSDRQIGVLFSGTGKVCSALTPTQRRTYTERIADFFSSKGIKLGIAARNALLNARIDNQVEVNVVEVLKEFKSSNIEPNCDTFAALSRIYALSGDIVGITEIVNHMKQMGISANEQIIESMVFALVLSGRDQQALSVIESFSKNEFFSEVKLRIAYANAKATKGDTDSMIEIFEDVSERLNIQSKDNANLMLDILFTLLQRNDSIGVEKLKGLLPINEDGKLSDTINFTVVLGRMRQYRDLNSGNIQAALCLYGLLPEKYAWSQRDFFRNYLFDKLRQSGSVPETVALGVSFEKAGILKNPRRILIDYALLNNRGKFYELYKMFLMSNEYKRLEGRPHLAHPYIVHSLNQLSQSTSEKKAEILAHIANALFKWEPPEKRHLKEWLLEPLAKNLDVLPEVMAKISKEERIQSNVGSALVDHLLFRDKFAEVNMILDGPLKGIPLNITNLMDVLKRSFTKSKTTQDELKLASRILACAFPEGGDRYTSSPPAVKVIEAVIVSKAISDDKAKTLIKMWADGGRIALSAEEIEALQKALNDAGQAVKAKLVTALKRKPKTLLRWKETEDVNLLEDEAKIIASSQNPKKHLILQTLYSIIAEKRLAETALNVDSMSWLLERYNALPDATKIGFFFEFDNKLRRTMREAIVVRNVTAADRLWKIGSKKMPTLMKIGYASVLHNAQRIDDAKRVLSEIHQNAETFDITTLANNPLMIGDGKESETFLELVAAVFKMNVESRRRLLNGIRVKEFDKLISVGHLEEAFSFAKDMSAEIGRAFGQLDLMVAALNSGDTQLLRNVITMVQHKHDKNTALLDFGLALLENDRTEHAARVFATSGLRISSGKLAFFVERETRSRRADVLLNLFTNLNEGERAATMDLKNLLVKLIGLYGAEQDNEGIARVQKEIEKTSFPVDEELRKCIDSNLKRVSQKPMADKSMSISSSPD